MPSLLEFTSGDAAERLASLGLPHSKIEDWRFSPAKLLNRDYVSLDTPSVVPATGFSLEGGAQLTIVDGFIPFEQLPAAPGVTFSKVGPETVQHFEAHRMAVLNEGGASSTLKVEIAANQSVRMSIVHRGPEANGAAFTRLHFVVAAGARLELEERFFGDSSESFSSAVTLAEVGDSATFRYARMHSSAGAISHSVFVKVGQHASFASESALFGGAMSREELQVRLEGTGANARISALGVAAAKTHAEHRARIDHIAPRCTSDMRHRALVHAHGTSVFDGQTQVHQSGPKAEAHQISRNLLVDERAKVHAKPHLEIDHDEVVASHGATIGQLDADALYYLQARGIPEEGARAMLTAAFLGEPIEEWASAALKEDVSDRLRKDLGAEALLGDEIFEES